MLPLTDYDKNKMRVWKGCGTFNINEDVVAKV